MSIRPNEYCHRDDDTTEIYLNRGKSAVIDTVDFDSIRPYRWAAVQIHGIWYAKANVRKVGTSGYTTIMMQKLIRIVPRGFVVDHEDGNGLNNRRLNLRKATYGQNKFNGKHAARGVIYMPNREKPWLAHIGYGGVKTNIGYFGTREEAMNGRRDYEADLYGDFERKHAGVY